MLGPLLGSDFMGVFDGAALFYIIAITLLVAGLAVQFVCRKGDEVALEDQGEFAVVSPVSTPVIVELDPRNEEYEDHSTGEAAEWDVADKMEMLVIDADALIEEQSNDEDEEATAEKETATVAQGGMEESVDETPAPL